MQHVYVRDGVTLHDWRHVTGIIATCQVVMKRITGLRCGAHFHRCTQAASAMAGAQTPSRRLDTLGVQFLREPFP